MHLIEPELPSTKLQEFALNPINFNKTFHYSSHLSLSDYYNSGQNYV